MKVRPQAGTYATAAGLLLSELSVDSQSVREES